VFVDDDLPADGNRYALLRLQSDGDDFTRMRGIDFTVVFPNAEAAELFAEHFRHCGYQVSFQETRCVTDLPWAVVVTKEMLPSHEAITASESELEGVAGSQRRMGLFRSEGVTNSNGSRLGVRELGMPISTPN